MSLDSPHFSPIEDALNELGKDLHKQKMPPEVVQQVYTGKQKLNYTPLTDMTRQDANDLRDDLLSRVSANSAVRVPEQ